MSTIDPAVAKREAQFARASRPHGPGIWIGLLVAGAFWLLFGRGAVDAARYPIGTIYLAPELYPENVEPALLWALFVGIFGGSIVGVFLQGAMTHRFGVAPGFGFLTAAASVCIALGIWWGAPGSWVAAPSVGSYAIAAGQQDEPWNAGVWIAWSSQYWVPVVLALFAALTFFSALRSLRREKQQLARAKAVVGTGRKTSGMVTEAEDTNVEIMNQPSIRVTVKFTDHRGVDRWVVKTSTFDRAQVPRAGDRAVVWFDPANPGDEDSIVVESSPS